MLEVGWAACVTSNPFCIKHMGLLILGVSACLCRYTSLPVLGETLLIGIVEPQKFDPRDGPKPKS